MKGQSIGTCIIVTNKDQSRVLLGRRKNAYQAGVYGLPGGGVEAGEKVRVAAERELREETGLMGVNLRLVGIVKEYQEHLGKDYIHVVFGAIIEKGQEPRLMEPDKCEGWEWRGWSELPTEMVPGHLRGIEMWLEKSGTWLVEVGKEGDVRTGRG